MAGFGLVAILGLFGCLNAARLSQTQPLWRGQSAATRGRGGLRGLTIYKETSARRSRQAIRSRAPRKRTWRQSLHRTYRTMSRIPGDALGRRSLHSPGAGWASCSDAFCGDGCQHPAVPYDPSLVDEVLSGNPLFRFDGHSPLPNDGDDSVDSSTWERPDHAGHNSSGNAVGDDLRRIFGTPQNRDAAPALTAPPPPHLRIPVLDGDAPAPAPAPGRRRPVRTSWKCAWCPQTQGEKRRGPHGPNTLCGTYAARRELQ